MTIDERPATNDSRFDSCYRPAAAWQLYLTSRYPPSAAVTTPRMHCSSSVIGRPTSLVVGRSSAFASVFLLGRQWSAPHTRILRALERQRDHPIQQGAIWQPAGLPELGVHRNLGEAGECIDLVDEDRVGLTLEQEIHPCQPRAVDCL